MFDWFKKKKPTEAQPQPAPEEAKRPEEAQPLPATEPVEEVHESAPVVDEGMAPSPSPLVGEGGAQAQPGRVRGEPSPGADTPHPPTLRSAPGGPLPLPQGERGNVTEEPEIEPALEVGAEPEQLAPAALPEDEDKPEKKSWFSRLKDGLSKSTSRLTDGITGIFTKKKLDDEALEELEELLIRADLGPVTAAKLAAGLAKTRFGKEVSPQEVREYLADEVTKLVAPVAKPLVIDGTAKPHVILVVGVNGTGKTTTIGKLARQLTSEGKTVWMAAGDTFRAAAVSQLKIWGERTGCPVVSKDTGADAAGLAYEALERARAAKADVLLIDTAGRLQNKAGLMEELRKVVRVLKKLEPDAPHTTLLTLDATTGQNAHSQVEVFRDMVQINGLILTKLDGSARGGVLVALATKFGIPVHAIGVGEGVYDMRPFEAKAFARALVGLE